MQSHRLESIPNNEPEAIRSMIDILKAKITREKSSSGEIERDAHPKQHGLVRAEFTINSNIPPELKVGIFKNPKSYDAWMRFSNQNAPPKPDNDKDIRGLAVKLIGVEGPKLLEGSQDAITQDFITISTDAFLTKDAAEFNLLLKHLVKGKLSMLWFFLGHWRVLKNLFRANRRFASPLAIRYFSTTPYLLGDQAVKYSIKPRKANIPTSPQAESDAYLKEVMKKQLSEDDVFFDFMIQCQTNNTDMPIEDAGKLWNESDSAFINVATIKIPKQSFCSEAQHRYGIEMSFNPWRCLAEHRPLGGINRARQLVYDAISKYRHKENGTQLSEPTEMKTFN